MFDTKAMALWGMELNMREELKTGSSEGIALRGLTFKDKALSGVLAGVVTVLLIVLPNIL
jgi:hypothetical protein